MIKISNVKNYNKYCENTFNKWWFHTFNKNYGYVLYGYNCLNVKNDFAYWFKTKKQALIKTQKGL